MSHPSVRLWYLYGPAGVGKTTLGRRFESLAAENGWDCSRVNVGTQPSLDALTSAIRRLVSAPSLLIVDGFARGLQFHDEFRDIFLPSLSDDVRVVVLGRHGPDEAFRTDLGWQSLMWAQPLRSYLAPSESAPRPLRSSTGAARPSEPGDVALQMLRDGSASTRELLAFAAVNQFVTTELVHREQASGTHELELEQMAAVLEPVSLGMRLLFSARRRVLEAMKEQYPKLYRDALKRSQTSTLRAIAGAASPDELEPWLNNALSLVALQTLGEPASETTAARSDPLEADDVPTIVEMARRTLGRSASAHAERWMADAFSGGVVGRSTDGEIVGYCQFADPTAIVGRLGRPDPALEVAERWLHERRIGGDAVSMCRLFFSANGSLALGNPASGYVLAELLRGLLFSGSDIAMSVQPLWALEQMGPWGKHPICGEFSEDGVRWTVCAYDLRTCRPMQILRSTLRTKRAPKRSSSTPVNVDFAVRRALRDFHNTHRLAAGPLAEWLQVPGDSCDATAMVRSELQGAVDDFGSTGDDARHALVLRATYFDEPRKQRAIASQLGMGYSTYRRHLRAAIAHLVERVGERNGDTGTARGAPPKEAASGDCAPLDVQS